MSRAPSSRSMTTSGSGAWKGGGMVWFTTKVWTRAPAGQRHDVELDRRRTRCRWGGSTAGWRWSPQTRHRRPEEPEHLGVAPDEGGPARGQAHGDGVVHGLELAPGPQRLDVGGASARRRAGRRRPPRGRRAGDVDGHGRGPAPAVADDADQAGGGRAAPSPAQAWTRPSRAGGGAGVAQGGVDRGRDQRGAEALGHGRGQLAVGVGDGPAAGRRCRPPRRRGAGPSPPAAG